MDRPFIPYGRQSIDEDDIQAVVDVLRSDWLTTGPKVEEFEAAFAKRTGARHAVAVSNGTAALHAAMHAMGVGIGDEVIVPAMTFVATANCVVYQGGTPVFCDVEADTLLIDVDDAAKRITKKTKGIIAVDYAGQPCDYDRLREVCDEHGLFLVADAAHSLGGAYKRRPVGSLADASTFSFHPVKHITTGEGGMVTTDDGEAAQEMRAFRAHGIGVDHHQRTASGTWRYGMTSLGYNYRLSDIHAALGLSQLRKLGRSIEARQRLAATYNDALIELDGIDPLTTHADITHAYHLYVIKLANSQLREEMFQRLRRAGVGANVHYRPLHLHPFYSTNSKARPGAYPVAEGAYNIILSIPMFAALDSRHVEYVAQLLQGCAPYARERS